MTSYVNHESIVSALGKEQDSQEIQSLLNSLQIAFADIPVVDKDFMTRQLDLNEQGVTIVFEDIGRFRKIENHDLGDGPYVLKNIAFMGYKNKFKKYAKFPINGLSFDATLDEVVAIVGEPTKRPSRENMPIGWVYESYKFAMFWPDAKNRMESIAYWWNT